MWPKSHRIFSENGISFMSVVKLQTQRAMETGQVSKVNELGKKFFTDPRKTSSVTFSLKHAALYFYFCIFWQSHRNKEYFRSVGNITVQVQRKVAAGTCHHGADKGTWRGCSKVESTCPTQKASTMQPYQQLAHGECYQHLQIFPTLKYCLKCYSNQTKHVCGPPVCNC